MVCDYINHSGGCPGSDMVWENEGKKYGIKTIAYSFYNHVQESTNPYIMNLNELNEGIEHAFKADSTLKRNFNSIIYPYVRHLIARNWFQVKHSDAVYAIGMFEKYEYEVAGGTGWAVQMAIDVGKPVYFFNQDEGIWYRKYSSDTYFSALSDVPKLTFQFAGIGTRNINEVGINAIRNIYHYNLNSI